MTHAIRVHTPGGPEALTWERVDVGRPGPGEVRLRHTAVGVNFIDVYHRTGLYKLPTPFIPGVEGAGIVEEVGENVVEVRPGDRVAYAHGIRPGSYAETRLFPAERLVPLPAGIDDRTAAAIMLKGLTTQMLVRQVTRLEAGQTVLVHAAAGGVGLMLCQWAKHLGVTVIGTVGSDAKAELARAHGCDHPINYTTEDFVARSRDLTGGKGVDVVYDSVGADTFMKSLDCLRPRGLMVTYGQSSGQIPPMDVLTLNAKGSLFLTRPTVFHYVPTRDTLLQATDDLFRVVLSGEVQVEVNQSFALKDAAEAHRSLQARQTTGSTVLIP